MEPFDFSSHSHRRYNPLTSSWILVSPHRTKRPWLGQTESDNAEALPDYDPKCYLCPGNARAKGELNPLYENTFAFENDYPAVRMDQPEYVVEGGEGNDLLKVAGVRGQCHVVCFSPKHNLTVAELTQHELLSVIDAWIAITDRLSRISYTNYVQIFENKGAVMGCSNPHPHCQVWATEVVPQEPSRELESLRTYRATKGSCLLCDYVALEGRVEGRPRIVCENEGFVCIVPFWAIWPYETIVLAKKHVVSLLKLTETDKGHLADIVRRITCRYDNVFGCSFPYSMGVHQAPMDGENHDDDSHLHLHFYPPLLRSSTVKKFLVGYEMLAEPQRDLTPEQAATRLRQCSEVHYNVQQSS